MHRSSTATAAPPHPCASARSAGRIASAPRRSAEPHARVAEDVTDQLLEERDARWAPDDGLLAVDDVVIRRVVVEVIGRLLWRAA